jgi:AhpD family alkylhydroperoxidase
MTPARLDYYTTAPDGLKPLLAVERYLRTTDLEPGLVELVRLRASLMNRCAYCVTLHAKEARAKGESQRRLFALPVWRETPYFSARERAALAWAESVTDIAGGGVSDGLYDEARAHFSEKALVDLTLAVIAINAWNRMAITFRTAIAHDGQVAAMPAATASTAAAQHGRHT